jgi:hypothetical protein
MMQIQSFHLPFAVNNVVHVHLSILLLIDFLSHVIMYFYAFQHLPALFLLGRKTSDFYLIFDIYFVE